MVRRRSQPWIHRWSRQIIGAIAILGFCLTSYLTITKLLGGEVACSIDTTADLSEAFSGCSNVLDSPYAFVLGLPLSLFGAIAYLAMAVFAIFPLTINPETNKKRRNKFEHWTWLGLLIGATAMSLFSSYLMYILFAKIGGVCVYCITSAAFSASFLILTFVGRFWDDWGEVLLTMTVVLIITGLGTLGLYNQTNASIYGEDATLQQNANGQLIIPGPPATAPTPPNGWEITTASGPAEISLAEFLSETGAKKYGAFWCPHCYDQKQLFGKEAFAKVDYIECDPRSPQGQPEACSAANVEGYPSWEINGELVSGTQSLERLAELSGYDGSTEFKYARRAGS